MKKFLSLVLALVMTMSLVTVGAGAKDFEDAADISYEEAVAVMSEIGIVDGDTAGNFNPTNGLTRGAAAKIICNLILGPTTAAELNADTDPFKDVAQDSTFAGYIAYCVKEGIVSGYADGTFKPAAPLTGYAFMKMLLGALGYDAATEGYTGANWSINVAKQAIGIGLNAGLKTDFNGSDYVTREEAMLYGFNTLKATMVDYDTTITIGDITVAGNNETDVVNNAAVETIDNDNKMQFAEKYFTKLTKKVNVTDDFGRPAITWINNKTEIGTFVDYTTLAAQYTTAVDGGDVYAEIGSAAAKFADVTYYIDGELQDAGDVTALVADLKKGDDDTFGASANGALTEVYVDVEEETIDVIVINTYIAEVEADYNVKKETLSVTVANFAGEATTPDTIYLEDVAGIEDYKDGDMILVQIADGVIVNVIDPEVVEDSAITKWSEDTYVVVADTQYDFAAMVEDYSGNFDAYEDFDALEDKTYNVYVDQYGYAIGIKLVTGTAKYVFVAGYDKAESNLARKTAEALVIFTDGTMANIEIDYNESNEALCVCDDEHDTSNTECWLLNAQGDANRNQWFKYTVEDELYTLTEVATQLVVNYTEKQTINCESARLFADNTAIYGNDDSVYITVNTDTVDTDKDDTVYGEEPTGISEVDAVYTGVQDVDLILDNPEDEDYLDRFDGDVIYALYGDADKYIDAAIVLGSEDDDDSVGYAYALEGADKEYYADGYYFWDFKAAVNGKIETLTLKYKANYDDVFDVVSAAIVVDESTDTYGKPGMLKLTYDDEGYVVDAERVNCYSSNALEADKVYSWTEFVGSKDIDPDKYDAYEVYFSSERDLTCSGRTLYNSDKRDVGLTLASGAPVILIQVVEDEHSYEAVTIEDYTTIAAALNALYEEGDNFKGTIAAELNDKGTAEYIVISSMVVDAYAERVSGSANSSVDVAMTVYESFKLIEIDLDDETVTKVNDGDLATIDAVFATIEGKLEAMGYTVQRAFTNFFLVSDGTVSDIEFDLLWVDGVFAPEASEEEAEG